MTRFFIMTLIVSCFFTKASRAQFTLATLPEAVYPIPGTASTIDPDHVSNYHFRHNEAGYNGQFSVYSWSSPYDWMPNNAGFAFGFTDNTFTSIYDNGFMNISNALEVEVGTMYISGAKVIVVTYYNSTGAYVDFYQYNYPGMLNPMGSYLLSPTGKKPRIDSHLDYAVTVSYQETGGIVVAAIESGTFPLINSELIPGTSGCIIPDVAFGHEPGGLMVRTAYYNPGTGSINVESKDFWQIGSGTPFNMDDVNAGIQTNYIDIDCPDHMSSDLKWAYTYDMGNKLFVRSYYNMSAASPYLFAVNDPFLMSNYSNYKPSITYEENQKILNIGWAARTLTGVPNRNIAVRYVYDGTPVTTAGTYLLLSSWTGSPDYGKNNVVSLSKNNETSYIFTAFSRMGISTLPNYDIRVKFKPNGMSTFKGVQELALHTKGVTAVPNPFSNTFILDAAALDASLQYSIHVADISGRMLLQQAGTIDELNSTLLGSSEKWPSGVYSIQLKGDDYNQSLKVVKE